MAIWDNFSDEELLALLDCKTLKKIKRRFRHKVKPDLWTSFVQEHDASLHFPDMIEETLFHSINDATNISLLILLTIIGNITLELIPLTILTIACSLITLPTIIIFFISSYRENNQELEKNKKEVDCIVVKMECANELTNRHKASLAAQSDNQLPPFKYENKHIFAKLRKALGFCLLITSTLFGTYYSGGAILVHAFGAVTASSIMLGSVGISIAFGLALAIGIFCGYKNYQALVKKEEINKYMKYQNEVIDDKRDACSSLHKAEVSPALRNVKMQRSHSSPASMDLFGGLTRSTHHEPEVATLDTTPAARLFRKAM